MASIQKDIVLDEEKFSAAASDMAALKTRTEALKTKLAQMYKDLTGALDTPAGEALELEAKEVLLEPVENMILVIDQMSKTLDTVKGAGYYKDVFTEFEKLNQSL